MFAQFRSQHADLLATLDGNSTKSDKKTTSNNKKEQQQQHYEPLSAPLSFDAALETISKQQEQEQQKQQEQQQQERKQETHNTNNRAALTQRNKNLDRARGVVSSVDQLAAAKRKRPPSPLKNAAKPDPFASAFVHDVNASTASSSAASLSTMAMLPPPIRDVASLARVRRSQSQQQQQQQQQQPSRSPSLAPQQNPSISNNASIISTADVIPASVVARSASVLAAEHQHPTHHHHQSTLDSSQQQQVVQDADVSISRLHAQVQQQQQHATQQQQQQVVDESVLGLMTEIPHKAFERLKALLKGLRLRSMLFCGKQASSIREQIRELDALAKDLADQQQNEQQQDDRAATSSSSSPPRSGVEDANVKFLGHGHLTRQRRQLVTNLMLLIDHAMNNTTATIPFQRIFASYRQQQESSTSAAAWWHKTGEALLNHNSAGGAAAATAAANSSFSATATTGNNNRPQRLKRKNGYQPPNPDVLKRSASDLPWNQHKVKPKTVSHLTAEEQARLDAANTHLTAANNDNQQEQEKQQRASSSSPAARQPSSSPAPQQQQQQQRSASTPSPSARRQDAAPIETHNSNNKTPAAKQQQQPQPRPRSASAGAVATVRPATAGSATTPKQTRNGRPATATSTTTAAPRSKSANAKPSTAAAGTATTPKQQQRQQREPHQQQQQAYRLPPELARFSAEATKMAVLPDSSVVWNLTHREQEEGQEQQQMWNVASKAEVYRMVSVINSECDERTAGSDDVVGERELFLRAVVQEAWDQAAMS